jgi:pimeloyl-ACP methyl ester carboxylesterase
VTSPADTRYARSGDVNIAYQVFGDGPLDVVVVPAGISHVEMNWRVTRFARMFDGFAEFARVAVFDKRGTGMSDRAHPATTFEERMDDVRAVLDAIGSDHAVLYGASEGGAMAALFAATYPRRTAGLVLFGSIARTLWAPDYEWGMGRDAYDRMVAEEEENWAKPGWLEQTFGAGPDPEESAAMVDVLRYGASPGAVAALERLNAALDVRPALSSIRTPTLVFHQAGDPAVSVEHGRYVASRIAGARYVELPGDAHFPTDENVDLVVREVRSLVEQASRADRSGNDVDRVLATVLFTDLVDSTAKAVELGDRRWRELLERHHAAVRTELARFGGVEHDTAGDGFFASFDGPARAVRCACAIRDALTQLGLAARFGLHTGECELLDGKAAGIAVVIGARIAAGAETGEVRVSSTVKDLVAGSGIRFEDRGVTVLKGVPGEWRVYAVADAAA